MRATFILSHLSKHWAMNVFAIYVPHQFPIFEKVRTHFRCSFCLIGFSSTLHFRLCFVCSCARVHNIHQFKVQTYILCFNKLPFRLANIVSLLWLLMYGTLSRIYWTNKRIMSNIGIVMELCLLLLRKIGKAFWVFYSFQVWFDFNNY